MPEHEEMFSGDDVEESSLSSGYSPSDYSDPFKGFQELVGQTNTYSGIADKGQKKIVVLTLLAPQLTSRGDETINTPAELDRAYSLDQTDGSFAGCERLPHWFAEDIISTITENELERCLAAKRVPREIGYRVPQRHERSCSPPDGYITFSEALVRAGVKTPTIPVFP